MMTSSTSVAVDIAVPFTAVQFADAFWAPRLDAVAKVTVPFLYAQCDKAGMIAALDLAPRDEPELGFFKSGNGDRPTNPVMFWDSDVGKWIEAAAYTLARQRNAGIERLIDTIAAKLAAAQMPDGYVNSYFQRFSPADRFANLRDWHELYCAGHLIEGAIAYAAATGKRQLLDVLCRYADLLVRTFGTAPGQTRGYCGHEEIELALIKLGRFMGATRYLDLARFFLNERGNAPHYYDGEARTRGEDPANWVHKTYEYAQAHRPVRQQDKVVGHAVRAMYLYAAMADLAAIDQDAGLHQATERLWTDLTEKRLYLTGGLGPSFANEGFTTDYDLPNETAYAETCAAVGLVMWAHRMALATGQSRYADVMERALYNGALSGLSRGGDRFFYDNPLASRGDVERWTWHNCPCCPANIARLVASLGGYMASTKRRDVSVHLYAASTLSVAVDGTPVALEMSTAFPADGAISLTVTLGEPTKFALRLRRPDWAATATLRINGETYPVEPMDRGYIRVERIWNSGDHVELDLAMPAQVLHSRPEIIGNLGRVALQRGPMVYCLESADAGFDVEAFAVDVTRPIVSQPGTGVCAGTSVLEVSGWRSQSASSKPGLYAPDAPDLVPATVTAIPYALWAHRGAGTMAVWLRAQNA